MAKHIRIHRKHGADKEKASALLADLANELESRYGVNVNVRGDKADVSGRGVSGGCVITDDEVAVDLKLKMPASLVAGKIESGIHKAMDKYFG